MTGSVALDVVIGLVFVYLLYSLLATILQEILATNIIRLRAKVLEKAIKRMLDDTGSVRQTKELLSTAFYQTPLIKYLGPTNGKTPAYIAARNFSKALLDILKGPGTKPGEDFRGRIDASLNSGITVSQDSKITGGETLTFLQSLWADAQGDIDKFRAALEQWFDDTMERATGWYKKRTQIILFFVGLFIAGVFNVDTVKIVDKLSNDPELRQQIIQQADGYLKAHSNLKEELAERQQRAAGNDTTKATQSLDSLIIRTDKLVKEATDLVNTDLKNANEVLALGWEDHSFDAWSLPGWIITALAISLGAPFWFDLLNKLMKLRGAVPPATDPKQSGGGTKTIIIPKG
ncbi:hypothetical protein [Chryseolinea lacunae]|uniref:Uncharacterized protein n=1 Tax=Chryseolinea lacunae TaxID=2801331 RepID=A0ABS1KUI9_9BACT|nr:hypothetical protein [Chryseolinea lacunae]MBL0741981.1 hypothetical protein [Chryseolinea lacunae]